jgi:hypothetical protein
VVTTFTLPAGQVLKSLKVSGSGTAPATLKVSSPGNPERVWTDINASVQSKNLNWTTAASTVTVKITCAGQWGASDLGFDDLVYGPPSAPAPNAPPSVAVAAAANPTPVTGTQSTLSVLLDDASLSLSSGGANLIGNAGFESGGANWMVESGAHDHAEPIAALRHRLRAEERRCARRPSCSVTSRVLQQQVLAQQRGGVRPVLDGRAQCPARKRHALQLHAECPARGMDHGGGERG